MNRWVLGVVSLSLSSACVLCAAVRVNYDRRIDFGRYHTYSWVQENESSPGQERITQAVDAALAARGWRRVSSGGDAAVAATEATSARYALETFVETPLPSWRWKEEWMQTTGATPDEGLPQLVGWSGNIGVNKELVMEPDSPGGSASVTNSQGIAVTRQPTGGVGGDAGAPNTSTTQVNPQTVRDLTIEVFDGSSRQLVFRGQASNIVSNRPQKNDKDFERSVADIFKKLPSGDAGR